MKHSAPRRHIPVLSDLVTGAAVIAHVTCEVLDDLAGWLASSRTVHAVAKAFAAVIAIVAVVVLVALIASCRPKDSRPGPIENTAQAFLTYSLPVADVGRASSPAGAAS
ncbi:hypothetical protein AB0425_17790 [Actinosynnema sp. NPDC051121]